jgi:hypothetical protein
MTDEAVGLVIPIHRYRVMFSDGETEDYLTNRMDSQELGHILDTHFPKRAKNDRSKFIATTVDLGVVYEYTPEMPKARRLRHSGGATDGRQSRTTSPSPGTK